MKIVNLLFPHQLFPYHKIYDNGFPLYLIEEHLFFKEFNFHKSKIAYHRASMKTHQSILLQKGTNIQYIDSNHSSSDVRKLIASLSTEGVQEIHCVDPTDNWLEKRIRRACSDHNIHLVFYESPLFIRSKDSLYPFFRSDKKAFFQTSFYKQQRLNLGILLEENGTPKGGKWSFDADNRKKYPKDKLSPKIEFPDADKIWVEAVQYVDQHFSTNLGLLPKQPRYPYTRDQAIHWLQQFLKKRFEEFGPYEDAIVCGESILHHSVLTPMMNTGLLSPEEVVNAALNFAKTSNIPLNSLEGFIRQIIGWREFIRGMYECKGVESRNRNFWNFHRKIPEAFYRGTTGIDPIDKTIKQVLKTGYCHHIERLMVLGNFMLLCEFHPNEIYRWFMELFIDAYDWVMVPNVYGMSQFADGGLFATKPYISGSNYIMKMSNYKKGNWQKTWDGLFWRFIHKQQSFFKNNPRTSMLLHTYHKMTDKKREEHLKHAEDFLLKITR